MKRGLHKYYMRAKRACNTDMSDNTLQGANDSLDSRPSENHSQTISLSTPSLVFNIEENSHCSNQSLGWESHGEDVFSDDSDVAEVEDVVPEVVPHKDCDILKNLLMQKLADWAIKFNIPNLATNELLKILQDKVNEPLPLDARTLLHTVRNIELKSVPPGNYYHFGLNTAIQNIIEYLGSKCMEGTIELNVNIDGLPLAKSSSSQVYPILVSTVGGDIVEMVGIYHGYNKPNNPNIFLEDFVNESISIITHGIQINHKQLEVKIKAFICDAPAKSYIKQVKGHSGYSSCTKCLIEGQYLDRICFPGINTLQLRTDEHFRLRTDEDHHVGSTILENVPGLDMINSFPLDYMHLVCLGVMKKLLLLFCFGKPKTKISHLNISAISESLVKLSLYIPLEFNRKPRSLLEVKRWKATEFRQILLYTGPLVLKKSLNTDRYTHFLSLHVAMTILSSLRFSALFCYAEELLRYFVKSFQILYGIENISHNVHNLLHLTKDVEFHGPVDNFSAFPFENFLQQILKSIRKSDKPLEQIVKRYSEKSAFNQRKSENNYCFPILKDPHTEGPVLHNHLFQQFKTVIISNFTLKVFPPDNCCCLKNKDIILISNIIKINESFDLVGRKYNNKNPFYTTPCDSSEIGIFKTQENCLGPMEIFSGKLLDCKYVRLKFDANTILIPLLHS